MTSNTATHVTIQYQAMRLELWREGGVNSVLNSGKSKPS